MTYGLADATANTAVDAMTGTYVQIHSGDPGAAGTANTITGETTRQSITWGTTANGAKAITGKPAWTSFPADVTVMGISEWTAASGGTFKRSVQVSAPTGVAVAAGGGFILDSSSISVSPRAA